MVMVVMTEIVAASVDDMLMEKLKNTEYKSLCQMGKCLKGKRIAMRESKKHK